jgi:hypothetical protein
VHAKRERKRRETGRKVVGRRNYTEMEGGAEMVALAKKLHAIRSTAKKRSLSEIADALGKESRRFDWRLQVDRWNRQHSETGLRALPVTRSRHRLVYRSGKELTLARLIRIVSFSGSPMDQYL